MNNSIQVPLTVAACKRLIAKGMQMHPVIQDALKDKTIVIIAGTTNGYIAEEILGAMGHTNFNRSHFFRVRAYTGIRSFRRRITGTTVIGRIVHANGRCHHRWRINKEIP